MGQDLTIGSTNGVIRKMPIESQRRDILPGPRPMASPAV